MFFPAFPPKDFRTFLYEISASFPQSLHFSSVFIQIICLSKHSYRSNFQKIFSAIYKTGFYRYNQVIIYCTKGRFTFHKAECFSHRQVFGCSFRPVSAPWPSQCGTLFFAQHFESYHFFNIHLP